MKTLGLVLGVALLGGTFDLQAPVDQEFKADADGSPQRYVERLPEAFSATQPHDVLIALHGHGSDRWQYAKEERGECKGARDFAAGHSMIFIAPDYRARTSWMGPFAEADVVQLIALLRKKHNVRRVFLVGASMGGTSALIFAALHPDLVAGVCSQNGTANMMEFKGFADAVAASYGGNRQEKPEVYRRRSPELVPEHLTMPLALQVGAKDTVVPPDSVRRLAARLKELKRDDVRFVELPQGEHATSHGDTLDALEFVLKAADAKGGK